MRFAIGQLLARIACLFKNDLESDKGRHFAERVYLVWFPPDYRKDKPGYCGHWLLGQVDDDNLPPGTLIAEYHFAHGQEILEEPGGAVIDPRLGEVNTCDEFEPCVCGNQGDGQHHCMYCCRDYETHTQEQLKAARAFWTQDADHIAVIAGMNPSILSWIERAIGDIPGN